MSAVKEIRVPDIGDFQDVEIIDIAVAAGDRINVESTLITLESDKASVDIPSPLAGTVQALAVAVGDRVSEGDPIASIAVDDDHAAIPDETTAQPTVTADADQHAEVVVLGGGPGGYTAAFRAADLGKRTILIERHDTLGGVCLNVGCIPSKALLHIAKLVTETAEMKTHGLDFGTPNLDAGALRRYTTDVINTLTQGLADMAKKRRVDVIRGVGKFTDAHIISVDGNAGTTRITFEHAIIAAGSEPVTIPSFPDDPRIMDSTEALLLAHIPERLLVIGGGVIGLEMATVYAALGSNITVVEQLDGLIADCDRDILRPLQKRMKQSYENIYTGTTVTTINAQKSRLNVSFDGENAPPSDEFDAILLSVGRRPNGLKLGAELAGVDVNEKGFIPVDDQQRTNRPHIFAIGDIVGQPMLAHKATHEGKLAAEVIAGAKHRFDNRVIPSVAYTDPEIAWVGITETTAQADGLDYGTSLFPWAASGRALATGRGEGLTKLVFDKATHRIIGAGIVGINAGELIAECALAIEMGADAEDLGLTIHPHPTLSETVGLAAEVFSKTITDLYIPRQ